MLNPDSLSAIIKDGRSIDDATKSSISCRENVPFSHVTNEVGQHHDEVVRTSDNWDAFKDGLVYVYGKLEIPSYRGIGRILDPVIVPSDDLKYAQVCKKRRNGKIVEWFNANVFGDPYEVLEILCGNNSDGKINTSYVERLN